MNTVDQINTT